MCAFTHNPGVSMMLAVRSSPGWMVTVKQSSCPSRANLQVMLSLLKRTPAAVLAGAFWQEYCRKTPECCQSASALTHSSQQLP